MSKIKLNKVELKNVDATIVEVKVDKRKNNPGRPINKKSARYIRLQQQSWYETINAKFVNGNKFRIANNTYSYSAGKDGDLGCIVNSISMHECNVSYIGRTKVQGYSFVLGKKVKVELNLKTLKFVS